ncbi:hypothetical protein K6112_04565 [Methylophilales bacterium]|nr:hypothetical protein K6112_04565 [Methylophilales bacterium]
MKNILYIFLSLQFIVVFNSIAFAESRPDKPQNIIVSKVIDEDKVSKQFMKNISKVNTNQRLQDYNNYRLNAGVSFRTIKQKILLYDLQFKVNENFHSSSGQKEFFVSEQNNMEQNNVKEVNLLPDLQSSQDTALSLQSTSISDYDELWIDYKNIDGSNPPNIDVILSVESDSALEVKNYEIAPDITQQKLTNIIEVDKEDFSKDNWQQKDNLYIINRIFNSNLDNNWRYTQEENNAVFQKRFNKILPHNGSIDLILDQTTDLQWLNLRLENEDGDELIVGFDSLNKNYLLTSDNNVKISLFLSHLQSIHKKLILKEIILFFNGTVEERLSNNPLRSLHFSKVAEQEKKLKKKEVTEAILSTFQIEKLGFKEKRIKFNLSNFKKQINWNTQVVSIKLIIKPKLNDKFSEIKVSKVRLISTKEEQTPSIILEGTNILSDLGIKLENKTATYKKSVWPVIQRDINNPKGIRTTSIDPQGQWADIKLDVGNIVINGSYLYIGGKEGQKKILKIQATAYSSLGENLGNYWFSNLNESMQFNNFNSSHVKVDYIKIRVHFDTSLIESKNTKIEDINIQNISKSPITNITLFNIDNLTFDEMLDNVLPSQDLSNIKKDSIILEIESMPSNFTIDKAKGGGIYFNYDSKILDGDIFFTTLLEKKAKAKAKEKILDLNYEVPWAIVNMCWLELTAVGSGKKIHKKLCFDSSSGKKLLKLPSWVDQIKWKATLPGKNNIWSNSNKNKFFLNVESFTSYMLTVKNLLVNQSVLTLDGNKLLPDEIKFNKIKGNLYFDLDSTRYVSDTGFKVNLDHPWLEVDKIVLDQKEQLFKKDFVQDNVSKYSFLKLLIYLLIIIGALWLIKSFWVLRAKLLTLWNLLPRVLRQPNIIVSWKIAFWWWSIVTLSLYTAGFLLFSGIPKDNYWFTFGGLASVLTWRAFVEYYKPSIKSRWPELIKKLYRRASLKYFSGLIVVLAAVAVMIIFGLETIADQLALIGYYMLFVGVGIEIVNQINKKSNVDK